MFRRRIIVSSKPGTTQPLVRAALEDDFHHFHVEVHAADGHVARIAGWALRQPYTSCGAAAARLDELIGMPLSRVAHEVTRVADGSEQCTHLFELAGLAIAAAACGTARRQYDVEVPMRVAGRTQPRLARDGVNVLAWTVQDTVIAAPAPYAGIDLNLGMARWALSTLPAEEAEAALVLRRCTGISRGRGKPLDAQVHASPSGRCYSQQPVRAMKALRVVGSTWDFATTPEALCADDLEWLAFSAPGDGGPTGG
ncbi:hypothetical protein RN01_28255 [Cupriavidus sp. SHE]|jgi:Protein of unknown function (DUF2889)|uniref:DUF2889 domain-containing protein n=1 Tax=Cupriavidus metallidurans TaxID=119219 RepID=A0A482IV89_9BURK|nr:MULTISPECIES: DUF2889 domain-containing protein [Cupriavidus]KWR76289.1 hypothetical protein RN01_28255 [Cupriavidus sp. SHE]QBP11822.1 DUF2889 domain-containing protein [Cupriavidus metallidurans]